VRQKTLARLALLPGSAWLIAFFLAPFALVAAVSVATTDIIGRPIYGWHFDSYQLIFSNNFTAVFARSILYAAITTAICLVLGYTAAYTVSRYGGRYRNALLLLVLIPWFVDYLIRIYSWIQIVGNGGVLNSVMHALGWKSNVDLLGHSYTVIGGLVYNFLPYMILALYVSIDQLDESLIEAGRDLYGGSVATLFRVTVPCTIPGILSGCLLVFLPAIGDFATAQLLGSPSQYMIGNIISTEAQTPGALPIGAGLTIILVGFLALVALLGMTLSAPWRRRLGAAHVG
jgi:spermidine/putrescine transport system permease protein